MSTTSVVHEGCDSEPVTADLRVERAVDVEGCWRAVCGLCVWRSLVRPEAAMARTAGMAHMARSHGGAWSGRVEVDA